MEIKYSEWAKINYDLYGVFFDKNTDYAILFKLTNFINTNNHNFNPSLVDKIFIPRNEYNNRKDIEKFDLIQLKQKIYESFKKEKSILTEKEKEQIKKQEAFKGIKQEEDNDTLKP